LPDVKEYADPYPAACEDHDSAMTFEEFVPYYRRRFRYSGSLPTAILFVLTDALALLVSFGIGFFIVNAYNLELINFKSFVTFWPYLPAFVFGFYLAHLYPGLNLAPAEEFRRFFMASFMGHLGIMIALFIGVRKIDAYTIAFCFSFIASIPALTIFRNRAREIFKAAPWWGLPTVIFGAGKTGRLLVDRLLKHPWMGFKPAVILDDDPGQEGFCRGIPVMRGTDLGPRIAEICGAWNAVVAMPGVDSARLSRIIVDYVRCFRYYAIIPDMFGLTSMWMSVRDFDGILCLQTTQRLLLPFNRFLKRVFDIILSVFGILLLSPLFALLAILVRLDSPGPVFYGHMRLGRNGAPFKAWKFRSMVSDSGRILSELLAGDPEAKLEWEREFKLKNDPRVTKIGEFLRKSSLDELPQLYNVLRGEMSLIGPRPIVAKEIEKYGSHYNLVSGVSPGVSGLWQVSGRSETDYEERVAYDTYYIQSWSVWLDLYIMFRTVGVVLGGKGAY
jgi:Undecaprenyl-phosphate galactose phosphotransferase WbaP